MPHPRNRQTDARRPQEAARSVADGDEFRVFAYGSLMWQPGFPYVDVQPGLLRGYHRAFCIYSHHYRGTPENPGLVLGLDRGGSCRGLVFRIAQGNKAAVKSYLDERELVTYAYLAKVLRVQVAEGSVEAYTYIADRRHGQYAGDLGIERAAEIIMAAEGVGGLNRDYLINSLRRLESEGYRDPHLHALLKRVEHLTGLIEAGGGI
jgi:cation transport protein ChaC